MATMKRKVDPRKTPRQSRSKATVTAILEATVRLMRQGGLAAANTNRIAEVAGVSVGSLYQYFPNKESLAKALFEVHLARTHEVFAARLDAVQDEPLEVAVRALISAVIDLYLEDPPVSAALESMAASLGMTGVVHQVREEVAQLSLRMLERRRAELRETNLARAASIAVRAVDCVVLDTLTNQPEELMDPAYREELVQLVLGYLRR
jgi:AcrR family transcriptional regulator